MVVFVSMDVGVRVIGDFVFLMIRRPPRSTLDRSSAASDVYKRQVQHRPSVRVRQRLEQLLDDVADERPRTASQRPVAVSYTHLRAHETVLDLVCRLLLEKKNKQQQYHTQTTQNTPTSNHQICVRNNGHTTTHTHITI